MEHSLVIRRAKISDASDIFVIIQKAFHEYAEVAGAENLDALDETIEDIENEIAKKAVFIAILDNQAVGTIRINIDGDKALISRFAVASECRNTGIGKSLMFLADKYLMSKKVKEASLYTASHHITLVRFYYGRGFYIESVSHDRGYPRARMVKRYF